jgi:hypothetical protein
MCVDASNSKSYPGSGSTWYDLTGNGHHLTLGSTATYSTTFGGVITFAKDANGYARNTSLNLSATNSTVISFMRKTVAGDSGRVLTAYNNNWLLGYHDTTIGDYYAEGWTYDGFGTVDTQWRMFAGTGDIALDTWEVYINTEKMTGTAPAGGSAGPNGFNINNQYDQYSNSQMAVLLCYNRVLTAQEIQQNFYAMRGRFGI